MLIPYDNDIIPIPKDLQRSFEDDPTHLVEHIRSSLPKTLPRTSVDEPSTSTDRTVRKSTQAGTPRKSGGSAPDGSEQEKTLESGYEETSFKTRISGTKSKNARTLTSEPHDTAIPFHLKTFRKEINPVDLDAAIKEYNAFNTYFYGEQRKIRTSVNEQICKAWTVNPLEGDPLKHNPIASIAKSLQTRSENDGSMAVDIARLPILEEALETTEAFRFAEISSWDIEDTKARPLKKGTDETKPLNGNSLFPWITHRDFHVNAAIANLNDFFRKEWKPDPWWRVHIELLNRKYKAGNVTSYIFESIWSIPTRIKPVPASTASIFFIIDVGSDKKPEAPVVVRCHYENSPMVIDPQRLHFGSQILMDIMERKIVLAERLIY